MLIFCSLSSKKLLLKSHFHFESQKACVCNTYYHPLLSNFLKFPEAKRMMKGWKGWAGGQGRGWSRGGWEAVGDQWCWKIKIKCFLFSSYPVKFHVQLKFTLNFLLTFSRWCRIIKSECLYFIFYFNWKIIVSIFQYASISECFTDPIFRNFSVERKKGLKQVVQERKEGKLRERLVIQ